MGRETERKFLVRDDSWRAGKPPRVLIRQAYAHFRAREEFVFRVRLAGGRGSIACKGPVSGGSRSEFEYGVPPEDARLLMRDFCERGMVEKYRCKIPFGARVWEVDEFLGANAGLIVAELELAAPEEAFERPPWLGREVTNDPRYYNACLAEHPFREWRTEEDAPCS